MQSLTLHGTRMRRWRSCTRPHQALSRTTAFPARARTGVCARACKRLKHILDKDVREFKGKDESHSVENRNW